MRKHFILFDLDGTLTDPKQGVYRALFYTIEKLGLAEVPEDQLETFLGPPLADSFSRFYGMDKKEAEKTANVFREYYSDKGKLENEVYPGIRDMLDRLQDADALLAVATSKPEVFARQIFDHFDMSHYFAFVGGSTLDSSRVSKADVIAHTLKALGNPHEEWVLMVGDRDYDIIGAKAHGLTTVGVTYGFGTAEEHKEAGADHIVSSVRELEELLLNYQDAVPVS